MPSFGESLTAGQIDLVVEYLRGFCRDKAGPRGELNLPRPLVTGKAFPEDEVALTPAINVTGAPDVTMEAEYEHRLGSKYQLELSMPVGVEPYNNDVLDQLASRTGLKLVYGGRQGLGDAGAGLKRVMWSSYRTGSILSLEGKLSLPLGPAEPRLGDGAITFDGSILFGQRLPRSFFVQTQVGSQQPIRTTDVPSVVYSHTAIGKSFRESGGLGRVWSPMLEFLADRDMQAFGKTNWDLAPQLQVSLSKRQHVRATIGLRIPASNVLDRHSELMFSIFWDWFDGSLREGWK